MRERVTQAQKRIRASTLSSGASGEHSVALSEIPTVPQEIVIMSEDPSQDKTLVPRCPFEGLRDNSQIIRRRDLVELGDTFKSALDPLTELVSDSQNASQCRLASSTLDGAARRLYFAEYYHARVLLVLHEQNRAKPGRYGRPYRALGGRDRVHSKDGRKCSSGGGRSTYRYADDCECTSLLTYVGDTPTGGFVVPCSAGFAGYASGDPCTSHGFFCL